MTASFPFRRHAAMTTRLPLVYACSGCSDAAQMANHFALRLTREGRAEMSCVAGIGGGVAAILRLARQGRPLVTLDGCALHCARACLQREGLPIAWSLNLAEHGVRKRHPAELSDSLSERVWEEALLPALAALREGAPPAAGTFGAAA